MLTLRAYQEHTLDKLDQYLFKRGGTSGIIHLFTGGGKTAITTHAIDKFWNPRTGARTIIVGGVNRVLTFQMLHNLQQHFPYMSGTYMHYGRMVPMSGIVMADRNQTDARVIVASIQSLVAGVDLEKLKMPGNVMADPIQQSDLLIDAQGNICRSPNSKRPWLISQRIDECLANGGIFDFWSHDEAHHAVADGSVFIVNCLQQIRKLMGLAPLKIVGNTATPNRSDDRGLHTLFETILVSFNIAWGQRHGYLVEFADPKRILIDAYEIDGVGNGSKTEERQLIRFVDNWADIVAQGYKDEMQGRRCFGYWGKFNGASAIADSIYVTNTMNAHGIRAAHIDGEKCVGPDGSFLPKSYERKLLDMLAAGKLDVINNHRVLIEGVDVPQVDGIILGLPIAEDNPVIITQLLGRMLRLSEGKTDAKLLDVTGQPIIMNSVANLMGYTVDPTTGQYSEDADIALIVQQFVTLWYSRQEDVELWIATQKRFKESTCREAIQRALDGLDLAPTHIRALKDAYEYLIDEDRLLEGTDLKDVRNKGNVRGANQTYELIEIIKHSAGAWYADSDSAMMSISVSEEDSFIIVPPNHTYARLAKAAQEVLLGDDDHPLKHGKTAEQIEKMVAFFTTVFDLYQNFTLWHLIKQQGRYLQLMNKHKLWAIADLALDVLEADALAYARDHVPEFVDAFMDKKKARNWGNKDGITVNQQKALGYLLATPIVALPDEVKAMNKGAASKQITHLMCVQCMNDKLRSPLPGFNEAMQKLESVL